LLQFECELENNLERAMKNLKSQLLVLLLSLGCLLSGAYGQLTPSADSYTNTADPTEEVKVVQELLRHANSRITLDLYAQAGMPNKRLAQSKLVRMVLNKGEALA
jgi:hypothetical protein